MPGSFDAPDKTDEAFDDEGFFITGDAMSFIDPENVNPGLRFEGRIAEDCKIDIRVHATVLRARALALLTPLAAGEITAKGNLNNRRILSVRAALVERLYDDADPATILA